jgi:2-haloacid dehalogenase
MRTRSQAGILCCDYYMTLVELNQPFLWMRDWMAQYLDDHYPHVNSDKFYGKFSRYRAVLTTEPAFRRGIDVLTQSLKMACDYFRVPHFADDFASMVEELFISPPAYPDAHMFLAETMKSYRVGLLTNADNYILSRAIEKQGFTFDFVITSEDARCNKPQPEIFEYALRYLGVNKQDVIMIGDSQVDDIYSAGQVGIKTIWVNRSGEKLSDTIIAPVLETLSLADIPQSLPQLFGERPKA